jgi:hypothetical protein
MFYALRQTLTPLWVALTLLAGCQPVRPVAPNPVVPPAIVTSDPVATVMAAAAPAIRTPLTSPDGHWRAEVASYPCTPTAEGELAYERLTLTDTRTGATTVVATQTIACGGLGAYGLAGLFWSANSRYLYFTTAHEGVPDGCGDYWQPPISRLDVTSRATSELSGGALSPGRTRLATWQGRTLAIWDVEGGDAITVTPARTDLPIGPIAWSPDDRALVYLQVASHCPLMGDSTLVRFDLPAATQAVLLESATPTFGGVRWDDPDTLILTDAAGKAWRYDLATSELSAVPSGALVTPVRAFSGRMPVAGGLPRRDTGR